jgi:hypothetical protein
MDGWTNGAGGEPPRASGEKLQASKLQHPEKFQAPRGARVWAEGDLAKNMKLRNEPILEMQLSPDFTDVKWRF